MPRIKEPNGNTITMIDRSGVVEVILLAATIAFFFYEIYIISAIFAFGLGVSATFVVDNIRKKLGIKNITAKTKAAKSGFLNEFVLVSAVLFIATIWFFVSSLYPAAVVGAFAFGIAVTYARDRIKS